MNNNMIWQPELPQTVLHSVSDHAAALMQAQSLTTALRSIHSDFSVRLLHLGEHSFDQAFSDDLISDGADSWFARDVLLCLNGIPVVWARSMCKSDAGNWRGLLDCGTRPLGEKLFDGSLPLTRSCFEYAAVQPDRTLHGFDGAAFAARRSFFSWQREILGLTEYFLPGLKSFV
ncbi:chorismate lyase [Neisseria sp. 74A18]|uniref:chorismate--pyruvate lyase family protein n=1 Tax=Neisseria sp. 74A18 TaxID=1696094 RepID=UPI0006CAD516|nr:chorismate lyase [Neisseria sp. 74A18]KPN73273.1 hypothetical protein AKG43_08955 [Neisseria sp. 74A18]